MIPFHQSERKLGAPWQNRTAVTWLQNRCNTIILIGQMLSLRRGNYSTSVYFWIVYIAPVSPSSMPSTHLPRKRLSCCQRWFGRPYLICFLQQLRYCSSKNKNHPIEDNSISFPLGQSSSCDAAWLGSGGWIRTNDFMAYETRRIDHFHTLRLAPQRGIEPRTPWLTVKCNYRCATRE